MVKLYLNTAVTYASLQNILNTDSIIFVFFKILKSLHDIASVTLGVSIRPRYLPYDITSIIKAKH